MSSPTVVLPFPPTPTPATEKAPKPLSAEQLKLIKQTPPAQRLNVLARFLASFLSADISAIVFSGRVIGSMPERLAQRLAGHDQALLWELGRNLHGHTVAAAAIGCALSCPLGTGSALLARHVDHSFYPC